MPRRGELRPIDPANLAARPEIARSLTEARVAAGVTQRELAARVGIHPMYLSQIETGESKPSAAMAAKIVDALTWTE